jgi:hypothetical protein
MNRLVGTLAMACLGATTSLVATGRSTATAATNPSTTLAKAPKPSAANAPFCTQMSTSRVAIQSAPTSSKIKVTAQEWTKLDKVAPTAIKASTGALVSAYTAADSARRNTVTRDAAFNDAAQKVSTFAAANCADTSANSGVGQRGDGGRGPGGPGDDGDFAVIQACMQKKGATLPFGGGRGDGGPPPGSNGQNGATRSNGTNANPRTTAKPGAKAGAPRIDDGDHGPGRGGPGRRPQLDAKTQKALDDCFKEVGGH